MKIFAGKNKILMLLLLVLLAGVLFSCDQGGEIKESNILSIEIINPEDAKFELGEVDLSTIRLKVNKRSGSSEIVSCSETMLGEFDRIKLLSAGSNTVIIMYQQKTVPLAITITETIQQKTYNVYFETNSEDSVIPPEYGINRIEKLTSPQREGYNFLGWFDNAELRGSRIVAPYTIGRDTTLYAKWGDNRQYTVQFLDIDGNPIGVWTKTVEHGGSVELPEQGPAVEGYRFVEWRGQKEYIEGNVTLSSYYERIMYTVTYYRFYNTEYQVAVPISVGHGDPVPLERRQSVDEMEGFDAKWQVQFPGGAVEDLMLQLEDIKSDLSIIPHYAIKKFRVYFSDDEQFKGAQDTWSTLYREVEYGGNIDFTMQTHMPIAQPRSRIGHNATWAVQTKFNTADAQLVWRNVNTPIGYTWNDTDFEWEQPQIANESIYNVYNEAGDVIARIDNGKIIEIKETLHIEAKYVKKKYRLIFASEQGQPYTEESVKFGTKYSLYNISDKQEGIMYGAQSKSAFTTYPVLADWDVKWYPNTSYNESEEIKFDDGAYIEIGVADNDIHRFYSKAIDLRRYRIRFFDWNFVNNIPEQKLIKADVDGDGVIEDVEELWLPLNSEIKNYFPTLTNKVSFGHDLLDAINYWYDTPQGSDYGQVYNQNTRVDRDLDLHARYVKRKFTITFRDSQYPYTAENKAYFNLLQNPPQVFDITDSSGNIVSQYVTMAASFVREYGYKFNVEELYFGGDEIYQKKLFIDNYLADASKFAELDGSMPTADAARNYIKERYPLLYRLLITEYTYTDETIDVTEHEDNYPTELSNVRRPLDIVTTAKQKADYLLGRIALYYNNRITYEITDEDATLFAALTLQDASYLTYNNLRQAAYDANTEINFHGDYKSGGSRHTTYSGYLNEFDVNGLSPQGNYSMLKYNVANGSRGSFEFKGWYMSSNFTSNTLVSTENGILESDHASLANGLSNGLSLYAKWVDSETGSEGLVFALRQEENPAYTSGGTEPEYLYNYEVIDYVNITAISPEGGYSVASRDEDNLPETYTYTKKDQFGNPIYTITDIRMNNLPTNAQGMDRAVKFPAYHNGLPVRAISESVFESGYYSYFDASVLVGLSSIEIERNTDSIGEGAFALSHKGLLEILVSEHSDHFISVDGVLYGMEKNDGTPVLKTLLSYPNSKIREDLLPDSEGLILKASTYILPSSVSRIAYKAFTGAELIEIAIEGGTVPLTIASYAFFACDNYLVRVGALTNDGTTYGATTVLPDRVYEIGQSAFARLRELTEISASATSTLRVVGENAFADSGWLLKVKDSAATQIVLGRVLLGFNDKNVVDGSELQFVSAGGIAAIADGAFRNSKKIGTLSIYADSSLEYIGKYAFAGSSLKYVRIHKIDPTVCYPDIGAFDSLGADFSIEVPASSLSAYYYADGWSRYSNSIVSVS